MGGRLKGPLGSDGQVSRDSGKPLFEAELLKEVVQRWSTAEHAMERAGSAWFTQKMGELSTRHPGFMGVVLEIPKLYDIGVPKQMTPADLGLVDKDEAAKYAGQVGYWILVDKDRLPEGDTLDGAAVKDVEAFMAEVGGKKLPYRGVITAQEIWGGEDIELLKEGRGGTIQYYPLTTNIQLMAGVIQYLRDKGVEKRL
jgi:hypothetical protein